MGKNENTPSESEWTIMEILWENGASMTSSEIIAKLPKDCSMTPKMTRVLINRLCQKGIVGYEQDTHDLRVYNYHTLKTKEACLREKGKHFMDSYFSGNSTNAMIALIQSLSLTDEQIKELEDILEKSRKKDIDKEGDSHA